MDVLDLSGRGILADLMDVDVPSRKRGGSIGEDIGARVIKKVKDEGQRQIKEFMGAPKGEPKGEPSGSGSGAGTAAAAPNPIPAPTTVKQESESEGGSVSGTSGQVQEIRINPPQIIRSKPQILTKTFRKKNQFYINSISDFSNENVSMYQNAYGKAILYHAMPWRHSGFYMYDREYRNLQGISKMYRYSKCGFKMSNITCHTGLLTGTGTPSVQLGYSGVLCMSNILGMHDIGPSMI